MITVHCGEDMHVLGIDWLTGESCAYQKRVLCGLTQFGADLICGFYGIKPEGLREPWNSRACGEEAAASFMLPVHIESLRELCIVGLFELGCTEVWEPRQQALPRMPEGTPYVVPRKTPPEYDASGTLIGIMDVDYQDPSVQLRLEQTPCVLEENLDWEFKDFIWLKRRHLNPGRSRHVHAMSGRTE